jgi:hypothetical protein
MILLMLAGVCYDRGQGTNKDEAKAIHWYSAAAAQGVAQAQHNLGIILRLSQCCARLSAKCVVAGVIFYAKDFAKACAWFEKAAAQNSSSAAFILFLHYQATDPSLSQHYFQRAKSSVWSYPTKALSAADASLGVSEHFAKWHYLNYHQHISEGFYDAGRKQHAAAREVIILRECGLQSCVRAAQKRLAHVLSMILLFCGACVW